MIHPYTRLVSLLTILLMFIVIVSYSPRSQAQAVPDPCPAGSELHGWGWSDNIGWINFNSDNQNSGTGSYCVSIDTSSNLVGWAWSDNIGWIRFGGLTGFPSGNGASTEGNAKVSSGQIVGWARACGGTIDRNCASADRGDGWDGWIELGGTSHPVSWNGTASSGYAWGSEVLGWIKLDLKGTPVASSATCTFSNPVNTTGTTYQFSWQSTNASSCARKTSSAVFTVNSPGTSGTATIDVPEDSSRLLELECQPAAPPTTAGSCQMTISNSGEPTTVELPTCPPDCPTGTGLKMWLENDLQERQSVQTVRKGKSVKINWKPTDGKTYTSCSAILYYDGTPTLLGDFLDDPRPNPNEGGTPYETSPNLPAGTHIFSMTCSTGGVRVSAINSDPGNQDQGKLYIKIKESTLQEI